MLLYEVGHLVLLLTEPTGAAGSAECRRSDPPPRRLRPAAVPGKGALNPSLTRSHRLASSAEGSPRNAIPDPRHARGRCGRAPGQARGREAASAPGDTAAARQRAAVHRPADRPTVG